MSAVAQWADGTICISRSVANDLAEWIEKLELQRFRPFNIGWFHLGADIQSSVPTKGLPEDADLVVDTLRKYPTFLMVGTIEPRKGHHQTLKAFEQLWEKGVSLNLVLVGKKGWMVDELASLLSEHSQLDKHLYWLEGISDEYLEIIYTSSTCLIAASEGEGFGLPLIEAAQKKLPIIARDIPVFREVAGENAYYFDGLDPKDLVEAVQDWLILYEMKQHPRSDSMRWQTWKQSAEQFLNCIFQKQWLSTIKY